jgi:hypothetical protein
MFFEFYGRLSTYANLPPPLFFKEGNGKPEFFEWQTSEFSI